MSVGDIAPREGVTKAEKQRLEAVRVVVEFSALIGFSYIDTCIATGSYAQFHTRHASRQPSSYENSTTLAGLCLTKPVRIPPWKKRC